MIASMHCISLGITVFISVCTKGLCKAEAEGQVQIPAYHGACRVYRISNCRQPLHLGKPYIEQARSYLALEGLLGLVVVQPVFTGIQVIGSANLFFADGAAARQDLNRPLISVLNSN
jgi:hypothetical protein